MRCLAILFALTVSAVAGGVDPLVRSQQCLVVVTDSWKSTNGTLSIFERNKDSKWRPHQAAIPVVVGRAGLAWGRGVVNTTTFPGPRKKEGDDKAPAGVFRLPYVFGERATSIDQDAVSRCVTRHRRGR